MITSVPTQSGPALPDLYQEHYRALVKLASLLVDDVGTCEEVVQDAFMAVHRRGLEGVPEAKVLPYLRSAVLNGSRSHLRKRQVRRRLRPVPDPDTTPSPESGAELSEDRQTVLEALRALPERQREVLVLRYWLELSEAEIVVTLGISPGSVKTHARRGLETLAARLKDLR
jgi:RNA polymerase sigma-70 factor (sigma-E family)